MKLINLTTTPASRFIVFSDAHRGDGTGSDDFAANSLIFKCALDYYRDAGFTIIAGHTHRPVYENLSLTERVYLTAGVATGGIRHKPCPDPAYYNAGSCVHPRCITGIEITPGPEANRPALTLIKWGYAAPQNGTDEYSLKIKREVLEG